MFSDQHIDQYKTNQEPIDNQISLLDSRVSGILSKESSKISSLYDNVRSMQDAVHYFRSNTSTALEKSSKDLNIVQASFMMELNSMTQERRDTDAKLLKEAEKPFQDLWKNLHDNVKQRVTAQERFQSTTGRELKSISQAVAEISMSRESKGIRVEKQINSELDKISSGIEGFKVRREEQLAATMQILEKCVASVQHDLANERKDRESIENQLLKLLEETCARVETAFDLAQQQGNKKRLSLDQNRFGHSDNHKSPTRILSEDVYNNPSSNTNRNQHQVHNSHTPLHSARGSSNNVDNQRYNNNTEQTNNKFDIRSSITEMRGGLQALMNARAGHNNK